MSGDFLINSSFRLATCQHYSPLLSDKQGRCKASQRVGEVGTSQGKVLDPEAGCLALRAGPASYLPSYSEGIKVVITLVLPDSQGYITWCE